MALSIGDVKIGLAGRDEKDGTLCPSSQEDLNQSSAWQV